MNCYCNQMYGIYGEKSLAITFGDGKQYCKDWFAVFDQNDLIAPALGIWIALTNQIITVTFRWLGKFKRSRSISVDHEAVMFNIFLTSYINTALLLILVFNSFTSTLSEIEKANQQEEYLVGPYDEFGSKWFINIGTALAFTQGAMMVFPHVFSLLQSVYLCLSRCCDRGISFNTKKTKQVIQSNYENLYTGPYYLL